MGTTVAVAALRATTEGILRAVGVPDADAALVADSLLAADRRGTHSHGVLRLPLYVRAVRSGAIAPAPRMRWVREHGATAVLDAGHGFGQVAMGLAVGAGRRLARVHGTAVVAVNASSHYGAGAYWTSPLAREGLVALLVSTTGVSVAPYGGAEKLLGTNPLTISFPTGTEEPVELDMATSAGAYGRVLEARAAGRPIPPGWAVDAAGAPTTDAAAALDGALLPFGGHKGSALAILLELLAGPLTGGALAADATGVDPAVPIGTGHLLWVVDPVGVLGDDSALTRAAAFQQRLRAARPAEGVAEVLSPGDLEHRRGRAHTEHVELAPDVLSDLVALADELGVPAELG